MKKITARQIGIFAALGIAASFTPAHASEYGCKVLLCLAAVGGTPGECQPPLKQLWKDLAKGRPFPTCDMATADSARPTLQGILNDNPDMTTESRAALQNVMANLKDSYARQGFSYYDPCPKGTVALESGVYAIQGAAVPKVSKWSGYSGTYYTGIGSGDGLTFSGDYEQPSIKTCVGNQVGTVKLNLNNDGWHNQYATAGVYEQVVLMNPNNSPNIIDVFVSGDLYRRVRW